MSVSPTLNLLELDEVSPTRLQVRQADTSPEGHDVVFGGQLLAQTIAASLRSRTEADYVKTINTIFSRAGSYRSPIELEIESVQSGRTWASDVITAWQNGKVLTKSLVLMTKDEPDLVRHQAAELPGPLPEATGEPQSGLVFPGAEIRIVADPAPVNGMPGLQFWTRMPAAVGSTALSQAILAYATNGWFLGQAMQAHPDEVQVSDAHHSIATGVISHSVSFHDRFDAGDWILLTHEPTWAGRGRMHGRGLAFGEDGRLVASFTQESMLKSAGSRDGSSRL
jgi:acyl-CoA thioesterase-2